MNRDAGYSGAQLTSADELARLVRRKWGIGAEAVSAQNPLQQLHTTAYFTNGSINALARSEYCRRIRVALNWVERATAA